MTGCRLFMIFARAIPEYIWAFLFLAVLGPIAWPLVLALAVHNTGILGRLGAEVVENTESPPLTALRALGATRSQMVFSALFPSIPLTGAGIVLCSLAQTPTWCSNHPTQCSKGDDTIAAIASVGLSRSVPRRHNHSTGEAGAKREDKHRRFT